MIISIQEKDLPLTEKICELVPTATVQADPANQLGGFKLIQPEKMCYKMRRLQTTSTSNVRNFTVPAA